MGIFGWGELSASEAVYGFAAWLLTRDRGIKIGKDCPMGELADLINDFCEANDLRDPRPGWNERLICPGRQYIVGLRPDVDP